MATALTPATMVRDSSVTFSPTSFTSTTRTQYSFNQPIDDKFFVYLEFTSTTNTDHVVLTVYAAGSTDNSSTVTWREDLGNLSVTLTSTGTTTPYRKLVGPLESSRFMGSTGNICIELSSSINSAGTANIGVAKMPYV